MNVKKAREKIKIHIFDTIYKYRDTKTERELATMLGVSRYTITKYYVAGRKLYGWEAKKQVHNRVKKGAVDNLTGSKAKKRLENKRST